MKMMIISQFMDEYISINISAPGPRPQVLGCAKGLFCATDATFPPKCCLVVIFKNLPALVGEFVHKTLLGRPQQPLASPSFC